MATFLMFGKYSASALAGASAERTASAVEAVKKFGGRISAMYATLGEHDLVLVADLPDAESAMKASVALSKLTGVSFSTAPAVTVEQFDRIVAEA